MGKGRDPKRYQQAPARGATTELQRALALPLPVQGEALPHRLRIRPEVLYRGQSFAPDRGTPPGRLAAPWRWLVDHRVEAQRGHPGDRLLSAVEAPFPNTVGQNTVGQVAHQLDRPPGQPAAEQADQLVCPHPERFVAPAQSRAHLRGRGQRAQKRQSPPLARPRDGTPHRQHEESARRDDSATACDETGRERGNAPVCGSGRPSAVPGSRRSRDPAFLPLGQRFL